MDGSAPQAPSELTRRFALLWNPPAPSGRGRKARFTLDDVVKAGTVVVLTDGLDALSMRKVAAELGVSVMSLYTYIPGRAELVDLMIDRAYAELDLAAPGTPWRTALGQYARQHWDLYLRHPWILQTTMWRAPLAPHVLDAEEAGLRSLLDTGLEPRRVAEILGVIDNTIQGLARSAVAENAAQQDTGISTDEYWKSMTVFWEEWFDESRYPSMTRVHYAGGFDTAGQFEPMLERLLDSVAWAVEQTDGSADGADGVPE